MSRFERVPQAFASRVQRTLAAPGTSAAELAAAVDEITRLARETIALTDGRYQPTFTLPV